MRLQSSLDISGHQLSNIFTQSLSLRFNIQYIYAQKLLSGNSVMYEPGREKNNVFDDKLKNSLIIFLFWKQTFYFAPTDVWARKREETNARSICPQSIVLSFLEAGQGKGKH